jgi:DNA invertase Pin-like site-specific DNA recombinase
MTAIPVAEYVRMSTEDQKYSIPSQQAAIRQYATEHGFFVSKTYTDPGKSGLLIKYRPGLNQLLRDVLSGRTDYRAILVYDVSRWGRFQNPDESAHYEFICANAGVPIHYCAEQFSNDGSVQSSLMKAIKRSMAGEFSRELGVKVFEGTKRLVLDGFHPGGHARYGLQRMLLSACGRKKGRLKQGERKYLKSDHVVLVRGNRREVQNVQKIFAMCADEKKSIRQIVATLNASGSTWRGKPWDFDRVNRILSSQEYLGFNVWAKRSVKLHGQNVRRPEALWVISKARFKPIIDRATFDQAQSLIAARKVLPHNRPKLLSHLRRLLARKGRLSFDIIKSCKGMPHPSSYRKYFGALINAYELVGFRQVSSRYSAIKHSHATKVLHKEIIATIHRLFPTEVKIVQGNGVQKSVCEVDGRFRLSVLVCGRRTHHGAKKLDYWLLRITQRERGNIALICLLDIGWEKVESYFLLEPLGNSIKKTHYIQKHDPLLRFAHKLKGLEEVCLVVRAIAADHCRSSQRMRDENYLTPD